MVIALIGVAKFLLDAGIDIASRTELRSQQTQIGLFDHCYRGDVKLQYVSVLHLAAFVNDPVMVNNLFFNL